jgi:hypothetical protein
MDPERHRPDDPGEYDEYIRRVARGAIVGDGNIFNGSTKFINAMLSVLCALTSAGIIGLILMYGRLSAVETKVDLLISGHVK